MVEAARSCIGTPFRHQGRVPGVGLDCVGVIVCALRAVGIEPCEPGHYSMDPDPGILLDCIKRVGHRVPRDRAIPGDMLAMWWSRETMPKHVAMLVEPDRIVHAYRSYRCVLEEGVAQWDPQIHSVWRLS